jgi:hypothetical protein
MRLGLQPVAEETNAPKKSRLTDTEISPFLDFPERESGYRNTSPGIIARTFFRMFQNIGFVIKNAR